MARANKLHEDISYIDDELRNNSEPFVHAVNEKTNDRNYYELELAPKNRSRSEPLLETDNRYNPRPTSGPEIDDLDPEEKPSVNGFGEKGIDDGLLPGDERRFKPGFIPRDPRVYPVVPDVTTDKLPDVNVYQQKKIVAQGMMDLALISANASQFRYILHTKGLHPYYYTSLSMIGISLVLQIVVGIGLIWNGRFNVKVDAQMCKADRTNNWIVIGVFTVTILNVFISTFSVPDWTDVSYKMTE